MLPCEAGMQAVKILHMLCFRDNIIWSAPLTRHSVCITDEAWCLCDAYGHWPCIYHYGWYQRNKNDNKKEVREIR